MIEAMAVIPARGGSKGLPRKNLRWVAGRPLLDWTVEAAQEADGVKEVCVSSDAPEILERAAYLGAWPLLRPPELATDTAATDPVILHAFESVKLAQHWMPQAIVLLQPTVPVRRPGLIDDCIRRLEETGADSLLTANPLHFVWWRENSYFTGAGPDPVEWRSQCPRRPRRQDMHARELMWHEDGSVYVTRRELLLRTGARLGGRMEVFETERTVDIDDERDLALAEVLLLHAHRAGQAEAATA